ncbi:MAG: hypothetical protein HYU52_12830 [Acidobacteria bacterium]|nr:hypothetical protein [Acidobacteriota bacterium]
MAPDATSRGERLLRWTALFTWAVVTYPFARNAAMLPGALARPATLLSLLCLAGFLSLFLAGYAKFRKPIQLAMLVGESLLGLALVTLEPSSFAPILAVIVAAQAASCLSLPLAFAWSVTHALALWAIFARSGEFGSPFAVALAYFAFQAFALITAHTAESEADARRELERVHAELESATTLLALNSRIAERTRISRDLHDVLGHHLAALSINLEVASHLSEGKAREQVEASQAIAKRLLADVRSTVSRNRVDESIDLHGAIHAMAAAFPRPRIEVSVEEGLGAVDPLTAEVVLRCCQEAITNSARHSGAQSMSIVIRNIAGAIEIAARDDGSVAPDAELELRSIRERVAARDGRVVVSTAGREGLSLTITIPIATETGA